MTDNYSSEIVDKIWENVRKEKSTPDSGEERRIELKPEYEELLDYIHRESEAMIKDLKADTEIAMVEEKMNNLFRNGLVERYEVHKLENGCKYHVYVPPGEEPESFVI